MISSKLSDELLRQKTAEDQIDLLSQAFEGDWKLGRNPTIKEFLEKFSLSLSAENIVELERQLQSVLSECQATFPRPRDGSATVAGSTVSQDRQPLFKFELPYQFGEYTLKELVGTGGKSVVYRGTRDGSDESYAIKITPSAFITDQRSFERELKVVSQLDHPRIIKPLYSGNFREWSFVSSKYLPAPNLRDHLDANGPLTIVQAVEIVASLAETLQYAHERGVIHRDLKPRNVLLVDNHKSQSHSNEQPNEVFTPVIIDFGLAKDINSESNATLTGIFFGTPAYTSPEQAKFDSRNTSNRSDVYSLGVILYELIGYSTPFQGSVESLLNQIGGHEVPSVCKRNRLVNRSLANIVHKCLRFDPNRRYSSAGELATDLQQWLSTGQVVTRAFSRVEWFKLGISKVARHRALIVVAVLSLLAINVLVIIRSQAEPKNRLSQQETLVVKTEPPKVRKSGLELDSYENLIKEISRADGPRLLNIIDFNNGLITENLARIESTAAIETKLWEDRLSKDELLEEADVKALANKAAVLARFGNQNMLRHFFKRSRDSRVRYYLINSIPQIDLVSGDLVAQLGLEKDADIQCSMLHTLGYYKPEDFNEATLQALKTWVIKAYENHPHSGVHALCREFLRSWDQHSLMQVIDEKLASKEPSDNKDWYITPSGIHMAVIRGPTAFWMGKVGAAIATPDSEKGRSETVKRSFAIALEPVTVEHYRRYSNETASIQSLPNHEPVHGPVWEDYVEFCNWLSKEDGLSDIDQATIELNEPNVTINMDRSGYRMPSLHEWELFARAGTMTDYHFGNLDTAQLTGFRLPDYPFSINAMGHCFTPWIELTSSQYSQTYAEEPRTSLKVAVFQKGGMRFPDFRRELWISVIESPGYPNHLNTFRVARTLPADE